MKFEQEISFELDGAHPSVRGYGAWAPIPRWHPRRWWSKYEMRRRVRDYIRGGCDWYQYGRVQDIARYELHRLYGEHLHRRDM
jgi:hypothetical protein